MKPTNAHDRHAEDAQHKHLCLSYLTNSLHVAQSEFPPLTSPFSLTTPAASAAGFGPLALAISFSQPDCKGNGHLTLLLATLIPRLSCRRPGMLMMLTPRDTSWVSWRLRFWLPIPWSPRTADTRELIYCALTLAFYAASSVLVSCWKILVQRGSTRNMKSQVGCCLSHTTELSISKSA